MTETKLELHRKLKGLNRRELAEKSGVHQNTIAIIEYGIDKPNVRTLEKLAVALGIEAKELL